MAILSKAVCKSITQVIKYLLTYFFLFYFYLQRLKQKVVCFTPKGKQY